MFTIDDLRRIRKEKADVYCGETSAKIEKETKESWELIFELLELVFPDITAINKKGNFPVYQIEISHGKLGSLPVLVSFDTVWGVILWGPLGEAAEIFKRLTGEQIYELLSLQTYSGGFTLANEGLCLTMRVPIADMMPYTFYELLLTFADDQLNATMKLAEYLGLTHGDSGDEEDDDSDDEEGDDDDEEEQSEVTLGDIFNATPKTNCKECGCPSCMIFAREVLHGNISIDECPYIE